MVQAVDNAKRLTDGDLKNLELARGPAENQRRRMVLNQVTINVVILRTSMSFVNFRATHRGKGARVFAL